MIEKGQEIQFYAEWVPFKTDEEKEKAKIYLDLWVHFFLEKQCFELVDSQITEKEISKTAKTLGVKISIKPKP